MGGRILIVLVLLGAALPAAAHAQTGGVQAPAGGGQVLVVGDSLAVGMRPFLGPLLDGHDLTWDVRSGRTTPQGLQRLRAQLRLVRPQTVVVSLGTNDGSDPRRFADRMRRVLALIPRSACVVWPSIFRPRRKGAYHALNRVLRASADARLRIVDWDRAVASRRVALPDGLHPDAEGYNTRARMVAAAVARCATG